MKNYGFENHAALIDHLNLEFTMKPLDLEETPYSLFFYINNRTHLGDWWVKSFLIGYNFTKLNSFKFYVRKNTLIIMILGLNYTFRGKVIVHS